MIYAYAWRTGVIEFGEQVPADALPLYYGESKAVRELIEVRARHGWQSETLLVPGVPEALNNEEARAAFYQFYGWINGNQNGRADLKIQPQQPKEETQMIDENKTEVNRPLDIRDIAHWTHATTEGRFTETSGDGFDHTEIALFEAFNHICTAVHSGQAVELAGLGRLELHNGSIQLHQGAAANE